MISINRKIESVEHFINGKWEHEILTLGWEVTDKDGNVNTFENESEALAFYDKIRH